MTDSAAGILVSINLITLRPSTSGQQHSSSNVNQYEKISAPSANTICDRPGVHPIA